MLLKLFTSKKKKVKRVPAKTYQWGEAPDVHQELTKIIKLLNLEHIKVDHIKVYRSANSKARARARIWSLPSIWRDALKIEPMYLIEVLTEHFDHLSTQDKARVLIHELMHIPKNFTGGLVPHRGRFHRINHQSVETLFNQYQKSLK